MLFWRGDKNGVFSLSAADNTKRLTEMLGNSSDVKERQFSFGKTQGIALYITTLVDSLLVEEHILRPLTENRSKSPEDSITVLDRTEAADFNDALDGLLTGKTLLFFEGQSACFICGTERTALRTIMEPQNEKIVRGAHDGFVENLNTNIFLLRSRVESKELVVEFMEKGKRVKKQIAIVYEKKIANPELIKELKRRMESINTEMIYSAGHIEQLIEDSSLSPFPQFLVTERPDRAAANIMEGRIAILNDGTPTVILAPTTFFAFYQSPDDYTSRMWAGSFYRLLRLLGFFIAFLLPALYIAVVAYHPEVIPGDLIVQMKGSVENIPYPPLVEALFMELTIELIREAGIRLPSPIGQTIGVVGGLVIGQSVVSAGLVSNLTVIVVALTAIAAYVVPSTEMGMSIRLIRFPVMVAASLFGFYGLVFAMMVLAIHLCKLNSLNTPYFAPFAPLRWKDLKDTVIRRSVWKQKTRPSDSMPLDKTKEDGSREWVKE
ncbi:spore germination protein [Domibacillus sp. A3M-37]|uniref:spore germination protein n=1 Tax=Domibacillus sp. A3M-37 TaxID=2962037 RepID=UPI0020B7DF58|nr:spore germination protein [Domibacillus sp. A3M-37]MCP3761182.1 spore germination protein [Domibacillus sp. A3M-37]